MFAHSFRLEVATFWRHSMSLYAFAFPPQHIATIAIVPEMLSRLFWRGGGPSEPIPESPMAIRRHGLRLDVCENFGVCRPLDFWLVPVGDAFSPGGVVFWAGSFQEVDSPVCHGCPFGGFFFISNR